MNKHTPGPWIEESAMSSAKHVRDILQAGGNIVLAMVGGEIQSEALANARLIAAAPELLEACKHGAMSIHHPSCSHGKRGDGNTCECHVKKCNAAIAKATK